MAILFYIAGSLKTGMLKRSIDYEFRVYQRIENQVSCILILNHIYILILDYLLGGCLLL